MKNEFLLGLWQGITRDLIGQGVDPEEMHSCIYEEERDIMTYSSNGREITDEHKTNGGR